MGDVAPLSTDQRRALARLNRAGLLDGLYLVGGTAVAIHLRHRRSLDLDLFSRTPGIDLDAVRADVVATLEAETVAQTDVTLAIRVGDVPVDVVRYPYPRLGRLVAGPEGVRIASLRDLAAMKLAAISRRGLRRDFWDLHEILTRTKRSLSAALDDYRAKFGVAEADLYAVIRALTWFDEAERDTVMPRGLTAAHWRDVKRWFESEAAAEALRRIAPRNRYEDR